MCLQHPFKHLKIKPVLPALMPDYTLSLCTPRDRQKQLAVPFGTILYLPAQEGSSTYTQSHLSLHRFICPLFGLCFSHAVLGCSAAASWQLSWCRPGVVQDLEKQQKKNSSFAISYSGTRGTCLSQGGPVNLCCVPELFLWSLAVMNHLSYYLQPNRSMGNGFKL